MINKNMVKLDNCLDDDYNEYINIDYITTLHSTGKTFWVTLISGVTFALSKNDYNKIKKILNKKLIH